jgi:hypothetical protein
MPQRYLTGDTLTDADIRLFVTLLRFDEVYAIYFKANARLVMLTPSLLNFCRDIYQLQGIASTCNMEQIKAHFFASHAEWNKYSVIPRGLGFMELLVMPHNRHDLVVDVPSSGSRNSESSRRDSMEEETSKPPSPIFPKLQSIIPDTPTTDDVVFAFDGDASAAEF